MRTKIIRDKIIQIILKNRGKISQNLYDSTTLLDNLGIDGDDAFEIMDEYFATFYVDKSNFRFEDYFGYEGFHPIEFIKTIIFGHGLLSITIKDLIDFAESGVWGEKIDDDEN